MRFVALIIALVLAVMFAVQNTEVVDIALFIWRLEASLAVIVIVCFALGALIGALALAPGLYRRRSSSRRLERRVADLEAANADLTARLQKPLDSHTAQDG